MRLHYFELLKYMQAPCANISNYNINQQCKNRDKSIKICFLFQQQFYDLSARITIIVIPPQQPR